MDSTPIYADSDRKALGLTIPSAIIIPSYLAAFLAFGSDSLSRLPLLFIAAPFLLLASIAGIPAIHRSHFPLPIRLLLFALHGFAALLALLPFIGFLFLLFYVRGPINAG